MVISYTLGVLVFTSPKDTCGVFGEGVETVFLAHASMSHCLGMIVYANLSVDGNMRRWSFPNAASNKLMLLTPYEQIFSNLSNKFRRIIPSHSLGANKEISDKLFVLLTFVGIKFREFISQRAQILPASY